MRFCKKEPHNLFMRLLLMVPVSLPVIIACSSVLRTGAVRTVNNVMLHTNGVVRLVL